MMVETNASYTMTKYEVYRKFETFDGELRRITERECSVLANLRLLRQLYDVVSGYSSVLLASLQEATSGVVSSMSIMARRPICPRCLAVCSANVCCSWALLAANLPPRDVAVPSLYRLALRSLPSSLVEPPSSCASLGPDKVPALPASLSECCVSLALASSCLVCASGCARWWRGCQRERRARSTRRLRGPRTLLPGPARSSLLSCLVAPLCRFELRIFRPPRRSRSCRPGRLTAKTLTF